MAANNQFQKHVLQTMEYNPETEEISLTGFIVRDGGEEKTIKVPTDVCENQQIQFLLEEAYRLGKEAR